MLRRSSRFRSLSLRRTLLAAVTLALLPIANASAQELPRLRVTHDTTVYAMRHNTSEAWLLMRVDSGTVLEFIDVDGDQGRYLESNWYLVLLPRNEWGTSWAGWISGRNLEPAPPRPPAAAQPTPMTTTVAPRPGVVAPEPEPVAAAAAAPMPMPAVSARAPRTLPEVVLRFAFDRSDLAETAKNTLDTALTTMREETAPLTFTLGGHADATGPDDYNQKLGMARADVVRQYIIEQLNIPADRITVSSYGETQPVASNDTRTGRAENRRVVVTVTAVAIGGE